MGNSRDHAQHRWRLLFGGAIAALIVGLAPLLQGSSWGHALAHAAEAPLQTINVPPAGNSVFRSETEFDSSKEYRVVISGLTRIPGQPNACGYPPQNCPDELADAFYGYSATTISPNLAGLAISTDAGVTDPFRIGQPTYPRYSDTHIYDAVVSGLSGHLYFTPSRPAGTPGITGGFKIEIYGPAAATKHLRVTVGPHSKDYDPKETTIAGNATVTICNHLPFFIWPFAPVLEDSVAKYTTLVRGHTHESRGWHLPIKTRSGKAVVAPDTCASFSVHNTSGHVLTLRLYDEIHSRVKLTLEIEPA